MIKKETPQAGFLNEKNIVILAATIAVVLFLSVFVSLSLPSSYGRKEQKVVYILYGSGLKKITAALDSAGLLRNPVLFQAYSLITGSYKKMKAGEYEFYTSDSALAIAGKMVRGEFMLHKVLVPEGSDIYDVAEILSSQNLADGAKFLAAAKDPALLKSLGIDAPTAEGYLFPDTYSFVLGESNKKIISTMYDRFKSKSPVDPSKNYEVAGYKISGYKLLILASIIEKEAQLESERPVIASVFYNRLKSPEAYQRRLESCATVRYALGKRTGTITYKDLKSPSKYNTYITIGLPPGPICNPGLLSMLAAINPAKTNYRYFVVWEQGEHTFSETLQEHNNAKNKNRKQRAQ